MNNQIRNIPLLKKILWADSLLGAGTAVIGLCWYPALTGFLGLPANLIVFIAAVTLLYALLALYLVFQNPLSIRLLRILVYANWLWTIISVVLLIQYFYGTTIFGAAFLILQVVVLAMLAYLEGRHIKRIGAQAGA
jgi:hypothetical protein